jgi:hypothetical protein
LPRIAVLLASLATFVSSLTASCATAPVEVATAVPAPGAVLRDGERFEYSITEPGRDAGRGTLSTVRANNGWVLEQRYESSRGADHTTATVDDALHPLSSKRTLAWIGGGEVHALEYHAADKRAISTRQTGDVKVETREIRLRDGSYDNDTAFWLWRALPLAEGYTARYSSVNSYDRNLATVDLTVVGREEITVPAGTIEAWRLLIVSGRASRTAWIEVAPPHRLVQWDNGSGLMQLTGGR